MFSNNNKQQQPTRPTTAPTAKVSVPLPPDISALPEPSSSRKPAQPKVASLVASDTTIDGGVSGDGELHVDGVVRGDVAVARLTVGETGHIEGAIQAEVVEARGRIIGSISAKQVRLYSSCHVDGDITHEQLTMEAGAFFQGRSLKFQRNPTPVAAITSEVIDISAAE
jgi:cytoskeletal protein CcmA (bactofilin family)